MITVDFNEQLLLNYLDHVLGRMAKPQPLLDAIGMRMEERVSMRFETESDPTGAEWAPWAPSTKARYPKDGHRHVLDRYGDMLRSLSHSATDQYVLVGFGEDYAVYHEYGTEHMSRRGLLTADPDSVTLGAGDRESIMDIVLEYLSN